MHRTIWTLLIAVLLQVLTASTWAMRAPGKPPLLSHCHETWSLRQSPGIESPSQHPPNKELPSPQHIDSHHCCAVGLNLGLGGHMRVAVATQAVPLSPQSPWTSIHLRPDLRPPI